MNDYVLLIGTAISGVVAIVAIVALFLETRARREDQKTDIFPRLLDAYDSTKLRRAEHWQLIRRHHTGGSDSENKWRVNYSGLSSGLTYLTKRFIPAQPYDDYDNKQLELELQSLNILDELCRLATGNELRTALLTLLLQGDIATYREHIKDLEFMYDMQFLNGRTLPKPRYESLAKVNNEAKDDLR